MLMNTVVLKYKYAPQVSSVDTICLFFLNHREWDEERLTQFLTVCVYFDRTLDLHSGATTPKTKEVMRSPGVSRHLSETFSTRRFRRL